MTMFSTLIGVLGGGVAGLLSTPQMVSITTSGASGTQSIASVSTANTILLFNGYTTDVQGGTLLDNGVYWSLQNATTIAWGKSNTSVVTFNLIVLEFTPGTIISQEISSVSLTGTTSGTDSITSISTSRAVPLFYGATASSFTTAVEVQNTMKWTINSSTQTQLNIPTAGAGTITGYANIVQFA